jgi:predicted FMN-binding regulatory protein PaiB
VHGAIELARDAAETRAVLDLMIQRFESRRAKPWQLGLDPVDFMQWSGRSWAFASG